MARRTNAAAGSDNAIVVKLKDGEHDIMLGLAPNMKLRENVTIKRKENGRPSMPCIAYGVGEAMLRGQRVKVALTVTCDPDTAIALGSKLIAETVNPKSPGPVKVRALSFDELVASGKLG